jgi:hypothetical protein
MYLVTASFLIGSSWYQVRWPSEVLGGSGAMRLVQVGKTQRNMSCDPSCTLSDHILILLVPYLVHADGGSSFLLFAQVYPGEVRGMGHIDIGAQKPSAFVQQVHHSSTSLTLDIRCCCTMTIQRLSCISYLRTTAGVYWDPSIILVDLVSSQWSRLDKVG